MSAPFRRTPWIGTAGIVLAALAAYAPALRAGFIWDDDDYVTSNPTLRSLAGLWRIWFEPGAVPQYYPLVHSSFWLEFRLWGLDAAGYHTVNVLLHALAAVLVWRALTYLRVRGSYLAALLFVVHPVMVESVAWITERKNVLSGVFYFAAALAWWRFAPLEAPPANASVARTRPDRRRRRSRAPTLDTPSPEAPSVDAAPPTTMAGSPAWYALSLVLFVAALLSKTVTVTLPAALLLVLWWRRGQVRWSDARPLVPFVAIGLVLAANTAWMERTRVGAVGADWDLDPLERILIAGRALWFYAAKLAWPSNLTFIYPRWDVDTSTAWQWLFPLGVVAVLAGLWAWRGRIGRGPLTAALFFCGTLVPALGFVNVYPMRFSFVADHFQYLASVGLLTLAAAVAVRWAVRGAYLLVFPLAFLTWRQTHVYKDLHSLWSDTLAKNPRAWLAHNNLGSLLESEGQQDAALEHYRAAVTLKPGYYEALNNAAGVLLRRGELEEAQRLSEEALRAAPTFTPALINRGAILVAAGRAADAVALLRSVVARDSANPEAWVNLAGALAERGEAAAARSAYEQALRLAPDLAAARLQLARLLLRDGRPDAAERHVQHVRQSHPESPDAAIVEGEILAVRGRTSDAIAHFRQLARRHPADASVHFSAGTLLSQAGEWDEAIAELREAVRLDPRHSQARNNLGIALGLAGRLEESIRQFQEAVRLRPNNPEALTNLAYVLNRSGRRADAAALLRTALRLRPGYEPAERQLRELGVRFP